MPTFKPEDLQNTVAVTFSPEDMSRMSSPEQTRTSTNKPSDIATIARQHLATGMGGLPIGRAFPPITPEQVKANPGATLPGEYRINLHPAPNTPGIGSQLLHAPGQMGATMLSSLDNLGRRMGFAPSPLRKLLVDEQGQPRKEFGSLYAPPTPVPEGSFANISRDISGSTGIPIPDPTNYGIPRMFSDPYEASYKRLEAGQSNADMFTVPAAAALTFGAIKGAPTIGRAILPADVAAELATRAQRGSLGTTKESFTHGATPDIATLQDPQGSVYRSQGRQLKGIIADKAGELDALEKDMNAPKYQNNFSDPMQSIKPVLDDAISRANPTETTRIAEFNNLVLSKVRTLSNGTMQLNPAQLVQLKRWMDGFISTYKDEPIGTIRDLAQNTYSAIRQHLENVAPESAVRGQRIQSLIKAEQALHDKIYTPLPEAHTVTGDIKRMFDPVVPSTLLRTGTAAALKKLADGELDRPPIPTAPGNPGNIVPQGTAGPQPPTSPQGPQSPQNAPITGPATALNPGPQSPGGFGGGSPRSTPNPANGPFVSWRDPEPPTHIEIGQQVGGYTSDGTPVSGKLQQVYPAMENGVVKWKALVADTQKGRIVDAATDDLYAKNTEAPPVSTVNTPSRQDLFEAPKAPSAPRMKSFEPPKKVFRVQNGQETEIPVSQWMKDKPDNSIPASDLLKTISNKPAPDISTTKPAPTAAPSIPTVNTKTFSVGDPVKFESAGKILRGKVNSEVLQSKSGPYVNVMLNSGRTHSVLVEDLLKKNKISQKKDLNNSDTFTGHDSFLDTLFGSSANAAELPNNTLKKKSEEALPEPSSTVTNSGKISVGNLKPIDRAKYELEHYGVTSEQKNAYRPGLSEGLRRAVDPIDEYDSTGFIKNIARRAIPQLLGKDLDKRDPQLDDAWRLYLGMPQKHNSFSISDYKPSITKDKQAEPYYYKIKGWFKNFVDQSLEDGQDSKAAVIKSLLDNIDSENQGRIHFDADKTMREYTMMHGKDSKGPYISVYDRWDLAPALSDTKTMNLEKIVGRPFEIYDRLYYDPKTYEPIFETDNNNK